MARWREDRGLDPLPGVSEPEPLYPDLYPIWQAWHDLTLSRPSGFGPSGLSWLEISRYCEDHGVDGPLRLRWVRLVRALDAEYLGWVAKKEPKRGNSRTGD